MSATHLASRQDLTIRWELAVCGRISVTTTRDIDDVTCRKCLESREMATITGRLLRRIQATKLA